MVGEKLSAFQLLAESPRSSIQLKSLLKHFISPPMKCELLVTEFGFKIVPFIIFVGLACKPAHSQTSFIAHYSPECVFQMRSSPVENVKPFLFQDGGLSQCVTYSYHLQGNSGSRFHWF